MRNLVPSAPPVRFCPAVVCAVGPDGHLIVKKVGAYMLTVDLFAVSYPGWGLCAGLGRHGYGIVLCNRCHRSSVKFNRSTSSSRAGAAAASFAPATNQDGELLTLKPHHAGRESRCTFRRMVSATAGPPGSLTRKEDKDKKSFS